MTIDKINEFNNKTFKKKNIVSLNDVQKLIRKQNT